MIHFDFRYGRVCPKVPGRCRWQRIQITAWRGNVLAQPVHSYLRENEAKIQVTNIRYETCSRSTSNLDCVQMFRWVRNFRKSGFKELKVTFVLSADETRKLLKFLSYVNHFDFTYGRGRPKVPALKKIWHGSRTYQYGRYAKRRANVTPRCGAGPVP